MILIAGVLPAADGILADTVRRFHSDGSVDGSFDSGPGVSIYTATTDGGGIAWQSDGKVIATGHDRPETEEYFNGPIRLNADGSLDRGFTIVSGYFEGNYCLELQSDGNVLVGGPFLTIHGVVHPSVARLSGDPRPPIPYASENPDTHLTVEAGADLFNWPDTFTVGATTAESSSGVSVSENAAAPDMLTVTIPAGESKTMFARLRVTISP